MKRYRHGAEVTAERIANDCRRWHKQLSLAERELLDDARKLLLRIAQTQSRHNVWAYRGGCRCKECRADHAAWSKLRRDQRHARLSVDPTLAKHGSSSTYRNWGCRCQPCTDAHSQAMKARTQTKTGKTT